MSNCKVLLHNINNWIFARKKSFQILLWNNSIQRQFDYAIDSTLTGITTPDQSGPGSSDNEGVFPIPKSFGTGV